MEAGAAQPPATQPAWRRSHREAPPLVGVSGDEGMQYAWVQHAAGDTSGDAFLNLRDGRYERG